MSDTSVCIQAAEPVQLSFPHAIVQEYVAAQYLVGKLAMNEYQVEF